MSPDRILSRVDLKGINILLYFEKILTFARIVNMAACTEPLYIGNLFSV